MTHKCNCGCCGNTEKQPEIALNTIISTKEKEVVKQLLQVEKMPVTKFIMSSTKEHDARFVALSPVHITDVQDSMETVKAMATVLTSLESKGVITICYDGDVDGFDYSIYKKSSLFAYLEETIELGKDKKEFLCDTAELELGVVTLTPKAKKYFSERI